MKLTCNFFLSKIFQQRLWKTNSVLHIITIILFFDKPAICQFADYDLILNTKIIDSFFGYDNYDSVCHTRGCYEQVARLQSFMNLTVDPCEDFYEFTCGNFVQQTNIPKNKAAVSMFSIVHDKLQAKLRYLIEKPITLFEPRYSVLVKKYYRACMNRRRMERRHLKPILKLLDIVIGGWPLISDLYWNSKHFDWRTATQICAQIGCLQTAFLTMGIFPDSRNSTKRVITFSPASLAIPREYFVSVDENNKKIVDAYLIHMVRVAVLYGADKRSAEIQLRDALYFEIELAQMTLTTENRRNITKLYNPITINQMQEKYPSVDWLRFINGILQPIDWVSGDEIVIIEEPEYMKQLERLVNNTPKRIMANYLGWRIVQKFAKFSTEALREEHLRFKNILYGKTKKISKWRECINLVSTLHVAVSAMYVQYYFNEESEMKILELVDNIRVQFMTSLMQLDWMDEETKKSALNKALAMSQIIGYSDKLLDNELIEEFYADLHVHHKYFIESRLNITLFHSRYAIERLHKPIDILNDWNTYSAADVFAYYSRRRNMIQFPAGILQGVFFDNDRPNYMNFGAIGTLIGHEITHGFDDQGRQFDKDGNLKTWWKPETKKAFLKKAKCIIDQYAEYAVPGMELNLNGVTSQGENIADNSGIKQSYYAYKNWVQRHGPEPMLPGLSFTPEQMFWISAASVWCSKMREEAVKTRITTGVHVPAKYRVLGSFSNRKEFAEDFNCPENATMNRKKKCQIW